ncbi:MAG: 50S ribosomal protein L21 [Clostridiales bacterium]|nr:50S ribosomal protein L21 [Clostridiales bacterium]
MYAIVTTGGKQYKVSQDEIINVEKLDAKVGDKINLDVLMIVDGDKVTNGNPLVKNAEVIAEVVEHGKEDKVVVFKYKAKKNYRRKQGHRQPFTALKIVSVK